MKFNIKNIFKIILFFFIINVIGMFFHFWAFMGIAFNDTGSSTNNFIFLLPTLIFTLSPLTIFSFIIINYFSKVENLSKKVLYFLQSFVILFWIGFYVHEYMPNSFVRTTFDNIQINKEIRKQEKLDKIAINELSKNYYVEFDNVGNQTENLVVYIKNDNSKIVMKYNNNDNTKYCVGDLEPINESLIDDDVIKYTKMKTNNIVMMDKEKGLYSQHTYFSFDDNEYFRIRHMDLEIYDIFNKIPINLSDIYINLISQSMYPNKFEYVPDSIVYLEIEKNENIISITEESLKKLKIDYNKKYLDYSWVIMKDGVEKLERSITSDKPYYDMNGYDKDFYDEKGTYEIFLHIYFEPEFCSKHECYRGYIKASNSIIWTNP